ncbi:MAG: hypothetical protein IJ730_07200 [Alphaproteobacteria bacterium]|nr:hypothetical protein [Alphaproteobacteria bacterium]
MTQTKNDILELAIKNAKSIGAESVDIILTENETLSVSTRLTKLEKLVQANISEVNIRVSVNNRYATISTDNINSLNDNNFIEKVVSAAKNAPQENIQIRPDSTELCNKLKKIDIYDNNFIADPNNFVHKAQECEEIALQTNGITNSEGAEVKYAKTIFTLIRDDGFCASYKKTENQISAITLAEKNGNLERDYAYSVSIYNSDLKSAKEIAKEATEKTLKRLGAKKIKSCKVPVVFNRETSGQLLSSLLGALNGASIARGISFLKDKKSKKVFSENITIKDKYAIDRGLRSRPFDSEGLECKNTNIITNGIIESFLLNTKYANKLQMNSTANASGWERISPNNVFIENGKHSFTDLIKNIKSGLYITEVLGNGINIITGNYSQGAVGFWIENGTISYPVHEITIAGNISEMFLHCNVASDLKLEFGIDSPTIFFDEMIVGGI